MICCLKHQLVLGTGAFQAAELGRTAYVGASSSAPWRWAFESFDEFQ